MANDPILVVRKVSFVAIALWCSMSGVVKLSWSGNSRRSSRHRRGGSGCGGGGFDLENGSHMAAAAAARWQEYNGEQTPSPGPMPKRRRTPISTGKRRKSNLVHGQEAW